MKLYTCPICSQPLSLQESTLKCGQGHSFDVSRKGYVNLVPAQNRNSKAPGDNPDMIAARSRFLKQGHYQVLRDALRAIIDSQAEQETLADLGCGDGYFTVGMASPKREVYGTDVSKAAIATACRQSSEINWAVASTMNLPLSDHSFDIATIVMAPISEDIQRILIDGGNLIRVTPGAKHLWEFKNLIYEQPRPHKAPNKNLSGFKLAAEERVQSQVELDQASRTDLLAMTPMSYRTERTRAKRALVSESLPLTVEFTIDVFEKT